MDKLLKMDKIELRKHYRKIRNNINTKLISDKYSSIAITASFEKNILKIIQDNNFYKYPTINISAYYPIKSEINSINILESLKRDYFKDKTVNILLPKMIEKTRILKFYKYTKDEDLIYANLFKVKEPNPEISEECLPDIVITPLLAFDKNKKRLGYGFGYYDHTFEHLVNLGHKFLSIGIAYDEMCIDELPYDKYDHPLDYIVTQTKIL